MVSEFLMLTFLIQQLFTIIIFFPISAVNCFMISDACLIIFFKIVRKIIKKPFKYSRN